jgi:branched-chain amino acid aminotransferase
MSFEIRRQPNLLPDSERTDRMREPGFGRVFTEHIVSLRWSPERGWHDGQVRPHRDLSISPAAAGLHYGQVIFEGLKAYRWSGGRLAIFRPYQHARRFRESARRLSMPELPEQVFVDALTELVRVDAAWVPAGTGQSLYLRPLMFGSDASLAVRPSLAYQFVTLACVVDNFFGAGLRPVVVWVNEDQARAAPGGTGAIKCAGNYAATFGAQAQAARHGCEQVVWLDPGGHRRVEELGAMNIFLVRGGTTPCLVTPPLTGTLLPGITRASLLTLAGRLGIDAREDAVTVEQWRAGCRDGTLTEAFACGTAARVTPIGEVRTGDGGWRTGPTAPGPVTSVLSRALFAIQQGTAPDPDGWMHVVTEPQDRPAAALSPAQPTVSSNTGPEA